MGWSPGLDSVVRDFMFSRTTTLAMGPTQPYYEWVPGVLSRVKAAGT